MATELIKQFLEAGLHFGHQTKRWNPKMAKYIYGERNGVYIIDLQKTANLLKQACDFLKEAAAQGEYILFVGTKKQAQSIISEEAKRCGMFYVNHRWLGGMLTNFQTVRKSVERYNKLKTMKEDGTFERLSKKEVSQLNQELERLTKNLLGVVKMNKLPGAIFLIDPHREAIAVREAIKLNIPVIALIDTNCDPDLINYPVPGNDDAIRAIKLIARIITDNIIEGRQEYIENEETRRQQEEEAARELEEKKKQEAKEAQKAKANKEKEKPRSKAKAKSKEKSKEQGKAAAGADKEKKQSGAAKTEKAKDTKIETKEEPQKQTEQDTKGKA